MPSQGNRHCVNCIGTVSFPTHSRTCSRPRRTQRVNFGLSLRTRRFGSDPRIKFPSPLPSEDTEDTALLPLVPSLTVRHSWS